MDRHRAGIAMVGIVVLITWVRTPPIFGLLVGATYLGLATGLGAGGKTEALTTGFGDVMAEIGILITFGVVIGSLLTATNTLHRVLPRQQVNAAVGKALAKAAPILAPIAGTLGVPVVLVALAACSGALFLPHVSSNFFWMFQSHRCLTA